jgi:hypothetical protein
VEQLAGLLEKEIGGKIAGKWIKCLSRGFGNGSTCYKNSILLVVLVEPSGLPDESFTFYCTSIGAIGKVMPITSAVNLVARKRGSVAPGAWSSMICRRTSYCRSQLRQRGPYEMFFLIGYTSSRVAGWFPTSWHSG